MEKAFIFDMDGVIIDSEPLHASVKLAVLAEIGIRLSTSELAPYVGRTSHDFYQDIAKRFPDAHVDEAALTKRKHQLYLELLESDGALKAIDGIPELLAKIKAAGYKIGLATSSGREVIEIILNRLHIAKYFDVTTSGREVPKSKPDPAIYRITAEALGVKPEDCTVIENATAGITAAKGAGMYCIAYKNPHSGHQDLSQADKVITSYSEIHL